MVGYGGGVGSPPQGGPSPPPHTGDMLDISRAHLYTLSGVVRGIRGNP